MSDEELREQLALYAVGALTEAERTELDDVLRTRPDLQDELAELQAAAAVMADAIPTAPPATLRASILDAIAETPQLPHESRPTTPVAPTAPPSSPLAPVVPITAARSRRWFATVGAAAAAVVAIVVGVLVVSPWSGGEDDSIAAVVEADDAVPIEVPGTGESGSLAGVTIVHSASEDAAVLLADSVPVPAGDGVYALWAIRDGTPEHFADFRPDAEGRLVVYAAGLDPASAEQWAITAEPAPDADTPTLPILNADVTPLDTYAPGVAADGVLITGVYGTGKSSLAAQIADVLEVRGVPYGAVDLDWLGWFDVGAADETHHRVYLQNVRAVVGNYVAVGARHLVLAGAVRDRAELDALADAAQVPLRVVRLAVPIEEIRRRLRPDPTTGRTVDAQIAADWLRDGTGADLGDLVVPNDGPIAEVAGRIIDWLDW